MKEWESVKNLRIFDDAHGDVKKELLYTAKLLIALAENKCCWIFGFLNILSSKI